jgi:AP-1 complex subunit sigma 1/2
MRPYHLLGFDSMYFPKVLDRYFGNVCELDIIFNFHKVSTSFQFFLCLHRWFWRRERNQAYYILDELFINGELQESSKKEVLSVCAQMDEMMDEAKDEGTTGAGKAKR